MTTEQFILTPYQTNYLRKMTAPGSGARNVRVVKRHAESGAVKVLFEVHGGARRSNAWAGRWFKRDRWIFPTPEAKREWFSPEARQARKGQTK